MSGKPTLPPLPPLSVKALRDLQDIEDVVEEAVKDCDDFATGIARIFHSPKRLERLLRTCLVEALNVQVDYYSSLPNYRPASIIQIIGSTVGSLIGLFPPFASGEQYRPELLRTATEHLRQKLIDSKTLGKAETLDRKALRDEYLARFSEESRQIKILDICWAAGQHYSEWKRWLRNAVKNGSAPDRAFRAILTSEKLPRDYRRQPRPNGWK
jgi:hypothetical protein